MKLVVVSNPSDLKDEHELIQRLFDEGMQYFHLRKPDKSKKDLHKFISGIPRKYYNKIILHDHYELVSEFGLKGIHINQRNFDKISDYKDSCFHKSLSIHSLEALKEIRYKSYDYVFLSPVYDSISKPGYKSEINIDEFSKFISENTLPFNVIALGGVEECNLEEIRKAGFNGAAVLGTLWNKLAEGVSIDDIMTHFKEIKNKCS